ncbi:Bug family tripartite tricarboxylate transporter substrate binding protein [Ramlibacter rhizophilus]|nr:tripartite tricarboxylate transporter substrate-binding protein [Ramlibacter rhizophilus]
MHRRLFLGALGAALPLAGWSQSAGTPLKLLVGFPPGGAVDVVARQLAEALRAGGYTVVVDNRAGAAGKLAIDALKAAPPDGETLMVMPNSIMTMERGLYRKPRFELAEFAPVSPVVENSQAFAVTASLPPRSLQEFLAWARENPAMANFASPGQGTPFHFMGIEFARASGVPIQHVPYKGGGQAMPDLLSGQVPSMFSSTPNLLPFHQRGQVRILAVSTPQRLKSLPDVPTFAEAGFPMLGDVEQFGVFAPARTPPEVVARLSRDIAKAVQTPALRDGLAKLALDAVASSPSEYARRLQEDAQRWQERIDKAGFKADA